MQVIERLIEVSKSVKVIYKKPKVLEFHKVLARPFDSFISLGFDASYPAPRFYMRGFFLESSVNDKIKSLPVYVFCLQRKEALETYISCFYAETHPTLFEEFNKISSDKKCNSVFFNWFEHEQIVAQHPKHRDAISNVFYNNEGRLLDYRVFDATLPTANAARRLIYSTYFCPRISMKKNRIYKGRSRFYKRKYN
jgi:hypothetical protein